RRIHYQIHRLGINREWYEEFYTEGILALWNAYKEYDETKAKIGTFLNYRIRYRLLDLLRKKLREQELTEEMKHEESIRLDDGNRHRGTGMPVMNVRGIVLENHTFWESVRSHL